eukprot:TRINITY_DN577_c0_g1_i2.p1 TRINITY_DN577_c0_g1~~TRINITY_DN577_c0_g1_i2.p1  ORF type:complete len:266 (+),score=70.53 TRINITY_DN577_c0_g1_i2:219-1016(+)
MIHQMFNTKEATSRIIREVIEDFASDNVKYLELRTTPRNLVDLSRRGYVDNLLQVVAECSPKFDIIVKIILSINRSESKEFANETLQLAIENKSKGVVGIELSGNPHVGNVDDFLPMFRDAKKHGLSISLHVAEVGNYEETEKLLSFEPDRIGHAICLNDSIKQLMMRNPIPLEICLTSNLVTHQLAIEEHHFKTFYRDYPVVLCTDDKGVFLTCLSQEYLLASQSFGLKEEELFQLSFKSIDYIFAEEDIKEQLKNKFLSLKRI